MAPMHGTDPPCEDDAFDQAIPGVRRRAPSDRLPPVQRKLSARPRSREADDEAVLEALRSGPVEEDPAESVEALSYRGPGLQDSVWRRLRRGNYRIGAELDLHGLNRERAYAALTRFIAECQYHDIRCIRVIHGKGLGSPNTRPVIKSLLDSWLRRRRDVLAFCAARPHDGGAGAAYVLLRARGASD